MRHFSGLKIDNLSLLRGGRTVLKAVGMSLQKGEIHLVTGPSGSGKTSLALALTGLIPQQFSGTITGSISIDNLSPTTHSVEQITQKLVCVLSDSWNRFFQITIKEELEFGPRNLGYSPEKIFDLVTKNADAFQLQELLEHRVDTLSGGQLQRVALAAAFTMDPDFIILDEPSSCLDRNALDLLHRHLKYLRKTSRCGVLLLEHRLTDFLDITDQITVLHQGQVVFQNTTQQFEDNAIELAHNIGIRHPGFRESAPWESLLETIEPGSITPVLELKNISAGFDRTFLRNISLPIYPGVTALVGPNGCGKSTLAHVLAGFLKPNQGSIHWPGRSASPKLPDGRHVGLLVQDASSMLFCDTVSEEIMEGPNNYAISNTSTRLIDWLETTDLKEFSNQNPLHLSSGQVIRTAAAATMILDPEILILDEPARGQDWAHLEALLEQTTNNNSQKKQACILITHDYKLIHRFAEYMIVLNEGQAMSYGKLKKAHND